MVFGYLVTFFFNRGQIYEYSMKNSYNFTYYKWNDVLRLSPGQVSEANFILYGIGFDEYYEKTVYYGREITKIQKYKNLILEKNAPAELEKQKKDYIYLDRVKYTREEISEVYGWYSGCSASELDDKYQVAQAVTECLSYSQEYERYVRYVIDHSQKLSDVRIFGEETKEDIKNKGKEYSNLLDIRIRACIPAGFEKLLANPFGDLMAVLMILICAFTVSVNPDKQREAMLNGKNGRALYNSLILAGLVCLFLLEAVAVSRIFEIGGLRYPVQTVTRYRTCTVNISMGMFLLFRTVLKVFAYYVFYILLTLLLARKRYRFAIAVLGTGLILEAAVLKETVVDIAGIFRLEKLLLYRHMEMYGFIVVSALALTVLLIILEFRVRSITLEEKKKTEQEYLADINEKYNTMRTLRHDMNNHLSAVLLLMNEGRNEEAKKYLTGLAGEASDIGNIRKTGMKALDLLLWNKYSSAVSSGIDILLNIEDDYTDITVSEYEMCSLFANIIDNAIEAVKSLKKAESSTPEDDIWRKRDNGRITLRTARQMDMLCIFCENPYAKIEKENGIHITTKKDKENHGLGLKQIRRIAAKHGGTVNIDDSDGVFRISVIMNI